MPKMKTHRGTAKRVKITGSGRIFMNAHHRSHKKSKKRMEKIYSLRRMQEVDKSHTRRLKKLLPYS
ncbi:MAG: 50S ribosomal protein L35 [Dehalococcoidia bacterium]|jgi:large subunit ribosomal protein L35|nr:50S ribosomal protein L35 [Dehalococcoidia bacterium]